MHHTPIIFFHLKLVAKISVAVGVLAALVLLVMLTLITGDGGQRYADVIRLHSLTRQHLGAAMLVAGLVLVSITGAITWLIVKYSSFRVAGPLYRFGQNLRLAGACDNTPLVALRRGDALSRQAAGVEQAVAVLRAHYAAVRAAGLGAAAAAAAGDAAAYAAALAELKALDAQVRL